MNEYAEILVTRHALPLGRAYDTYEWIGDPTQPVFIDWRLEDMIDKLPWPLVKVEDRPEYGAALYARKDSRFWLPAYWMRLKFAIRRRFEQVYYRLILTAMVWGLAYVEPGKIPSWKDLGRKPKYGS